MENSTILTVPETPESFLQYLQGPEVTCRGRVCQITRKVSEFTSHGSSSLPPWFTWWWGQPTALIRGGQMRQVRLRVGAKMSHQVRSLTLRPKMWVIDQRVCSWGQAQGPCSSEAKQMQKNVSHATHLPSFFLFLNPWTIYSFWLKIPPKTLQLTCFHLPVKKKKR